MCAMVVEGGGRSGRAVRQKEKSGLLERLAMMAEGVEGSVKGAT